MKKKQRIWHTHIENSTIDKFLQHLRQIRSDIKILDRINPVPSSSANKHPRKQALRLRAHRQHQKYHMDLGFIKISAIYRFGKDFYKCHKQIIGVPLLRNTNVPCLILDCCFGFQDPVFERKWFTEINFLQIKVIFGNDSLLQLIQIFNRSQDQFRVDWLLSGFARTQFYARTEQRFAAFLSRTLRTRLRWCFNRQVRSWVAPENFLRGIRSFATIFLIGSFSWDFRCRVRIWRWFRWKKCTANSWRVRRRNFVLVVLESDGFYDILGRWRLREFESSLPIARERSHRPGWRLDRGWNFPAGRRGPFFIRWFFAYISWRCLMPLETFWWRWSIAGLSKSFDCLFPWQGWH